MYMMKEYPKMMEYDFTAGEGCSDEDRQEYGDAVTLMINEFRDFKFIMDDDLK